MKIRGTWRILGQSTGHDQNIIRSECGQAISADHISNNAWKPHLWLVSLSQNVTNTRKSNRPWQKSVLELVRIHQRAKFQSISYMRSPEYARNHKLGLFPESKCHQNKQNPNSKISSESGQDISACQIWGHASLAFFRKCAKTTNLTCFTQWKSHQNEQNQQTSTNIWSLLKVVVSKFDLFH